MSSDLSKLRSGVRLHAKALALAEIFHDEHRAKQAFEEAKVAHEAGVDGYEELESLESHKSRFALRRSPAVRAALQEFWESALRSMQSGGDLSVSSVDQIGYSIMMERIYRTLIEECDEDDVHDTIEEDWDADSKGEDSMDRSAFCDAIFELCDVWSPAQTEEEYASFIRALHLQVTDEMPSHVPGEEKRVKYRYIWKVGGGEEGMESDVFDEERKLEQRARRSLSRENMCIHTEPRTSSFGRRGLADVDGERGEGGEGGGAQMSPSAAAVPSVRTQRHRAAARRRRSAVRIESAVRGRKARKESINRSRATQDIQRVQRGASARKGLDERRQAAVKLQSVARGRKARKETKERKAQWKLDGGQDGGGDSQLPVAPLTVQGMSVATGAPKPAAPRAAAPREAAAPRASERSDILRTGSEQEPPLQPQSLPAQEPMPSQQATAASPTPAEPTSFDQDPPRPGPSDGRAGQSDPEAAIMMAPAPLPQEDTLRPCSQPGGVSASSADGFGTGDGDGPIDANAAILDPMINPRVSSAPHLLTTSQYSQQSWESCGSSLPPRYSPGPIGPSSYPGWLYAQHGPTLRPPSRQLQMPTTSTRAKLRVQPDDKQYTARLRKPRLPQGRLPSSRKWPQAQSRGLAEQLRLAAAALATEAGQKAARGAWPPPTITVRTPFWELETTAHPEPRSPSATNAHSGSLHGTASHAAAHAAAHAADGAAGGHESQGWYGERTTLRAVDKSRMPRQANTSRCATPPAMGAMGRAQGRLSRPSSMPSGACGLFPTGCGTSSCGGPTSSRPMTPGSLAPPEAASFASFAGAGAGPFMGPGASPPGTPSSLLPPSAPPGTPFSQYGGGLGDLSAWGAEVSGFGQLLPTKPMLLPQHKPASGVVQVSSLPAHGRKMVRSASMWVPHRSSLNVGRAEYVKSLPRQPAPSGEPRVKAWDEGALVVLDTRPSPWALDTTPSPWALDAHTAPSPWALPYL